MKKSLLIASAATLAALSVPAAACDPVPGALIFGGIGAAIGNAPGAAIGAIIGSAITGSAPCHGYYGRYRDDRVYYGGYDRGYDRRYERGPDVGYYDSVPGSGYVREREVGYERRYAPAPVYYEPAYYPAPVVVYRSSPRRYYEPRYARYDAPRYRYAENRRYERDRRDWR